MSDYDMVIAGGGMVGAALACALGGSELRIAVLEGVPPPAWQPDSEMDVRVSAITRASQRIFAAIGVWEAIESSRVSPFREMEVWDAGGPGRIHFDSADIGESLLGWIIENRVIQTALWERMKTLTHVDLLCPASLDSADFEGPGIRLRLEDGRELATRLLVGADGANSRVRQLANIAAGGWGYGQTSVVATVGTELPHRETAWQRFLPTGPLAFLPLCDARSSIVWTTTPEQAEHLLTLDDELFGWELAEAFGWRLGRITQAGPRGGFPLRLQHAHAYVRPGIALIGDAAHVVHPLAGQGVNLGLLDAAALAEVLLDARVRGQDPASFKALRRYERWRKGDNLLMLGVLDGFKRLFGTDLAPVRWLRNIGLNLTDTATPVKNLIAHRAMGLAGDLPRLARP